MDDSRKVCKELDDLSMRILELMEEQIQNNNNLQQLMKYGFIDIAKARYIMGNRNLSKLQLPSSNSNEFTALSTVKFESVEDDETGKFVLETVKKTSPSKQAKTGDSLGGRKHTSEEKGTNENNEEETAKIVDPLKWFGLLVPQNLRNAQSRFTTAVEFTTQGANIQLELASTQNKYKLMCDKKSCSKPEAAKNTSFSKKKIKKDKICEVKPLPRDDAPW